MKAKFENADLPLTMQGIRKQIQDSIPFAKNFVPAFGNPKDIFYFLKRNTIYKNDPPGIELLQSMQTLFTNNYYGRPGMGDCDCFVISYTAACLSQGIPCCIVLAGRKKNQFVHILNYVQFHGSWVPADLTEPVFDQERPYSYKKYFLCEY
jgi:hypothetical protein